MTTPTEWSVDWEPEPLGSRKGWRAFATRIGPLGNQQVIEAVGDTMEEALDALPGRIAEVGDRACFCGCCEHETADA